MKKITSRCQAPIKQNTPYRELQSLNENLEVYLNNKQIPLFIFMLPVCPLQRNYPSILSTQGSLIISTFVTQADA